MKFGNIKIIIIRMYVSIIFMYNPYLLKDVILVSHKIVSSQDIWMWKVHCWKKQNKIAKHFKLFFSGTIERMFENCSRHNSMTELCRILFQYENKRDMVWDNSLKTSWFAKMRRRVEKGGVLGWNPSERRHIRKITKRAVNL